MANEEHVGRLKQGVAAWNVWRAENESVVPDLRGADLNHADLFEADLNHADLYQADLSYADLNYADLSSADLSGSSLRHAGLYYADLSHADLRVANLNAADLRGANLNAADLGLASVRETYFTDVDLSNVIGLDYCLHIGPSSIDVRTLERSPNLPLAFLRGVGLPDSLIDYLPSLLNRPIQFYSCFISYSAKDQDVAERLHADLQNNPHSPDDALS